MAKRSRDRARGSRQAAAGAVCGPAAVDRLLATALECVEAGEPGRAEMVLGQILRGDPLNPAACSLLGEVLMGSRRFEEAVEPLRVAMESNLASAAGHRRVGEALLQAGDPDAALAHLERACELAPTDAHAHDARGLAELDLGRFAGAESSFRTALELDPAVPGVCLNLSRCRRFTAEDQALLADVERVLRCGLPEVLTADVHFALGKMHDDLGGLDRAFEHYREANRIVHRQLGYDAAAQDRAVDRLCESFPAERFRGALGDPNELPVFVVGMPRSGTSLVEQMLAAHPRVYGGGERLHIDALSRCIRREIGAREPYPRCVAELDGPAIRRLAETYLTGLKSGSGEAERATDKLPTNFQHLGLVRLLLPNARIIHCRRDPMDTAFSIYTQQFESGNAWAYDFDDIAAFYAGYERLMGHWREVLPDPPLEVSYERLISTPDAVCREMLDHLDLSWHDDCLEFHRSTRAVGTASNWQVRQPLYRSSVGRWRRYATFLEPLAHALGRHGVVWSESGESELPAGPAFQP